MNHIDVKRFLLLSRCGSVVSFFFCFSNICFQNCLNNFLFYFNFFNYFNFFQSFFYLSVAVSHLFFLQVAKMTLKIQKCKSLTTNSAMNATVIKVNEIIQTTKSAFKCSRLIGCQGWECEKL